MKLNSMLLAGASVLLLAACSGGESDPSSTAEAAQPAETTEATEATTDTSGDTVTETETVTIDVPAGTYNVDPTHAFLTATVVHMGLSHYTMNFTDFDASIDFNPDDLGSSQITLDITPVVDVNYPADYKAGHADSPYESWPEALSQDTRFIGGSEYSEIKFVSTNAEQTGPSTGTVTGDLTFLGETRPVTLDVTYINGKESMWSPGQHIIGFDAKGTILRSDFGQTSLQGMISDEVEIDFSGEFTEMVDSEEASTEE